MDQRIYCDIDTRIRDPLRDDLDTTLRRAQDDFARALETEVDGRIPKPEAGYFQAIVFQETFALLCGFDASADGAGDIKIGNRVVQNLRDVMSTWPPTEPE